MKGQHKVVLGFAPTRRNMYDKAYAHQNKREIRKRIQELMREQAEIVDIDWLNEEGLLIEMEDVKKVADHFRNREVDALFMPHCNFGSEEVVGKLGKLMNKPFLLWGPRDQAPPPGPVVRQTDTQCGLFASSKALQRYGVPFTYIENCYTQDQAFADGFRNFIRTACVVKTFYNMRIGQISLRPKPFLSVMINESELLQRFGIEVVPITGVEVVQKVENIIKGAPDALEAVVNDINSKIDCSAMAEEEIRKIAALELAFMEVAEENQCNVLASECWRVFYQSIGIRTCFVFGDVTDRGLPVACETDIHGAITSALLSAACLGETPTFLADLTIRHPENDNAELLWHCGPFPKSLAKEPEKRVMKDCKGYWELKGGDVTIARFDGCNGGYSLFAGHGVGVDGPVTNGNYLWVETNNWVEWERKFIYGPYIHHVSAVHGQYAPILHEACRYIEGVDVDTV